MADEQVFDITIIGGGPTGLFGAFYAGLAVFGSLSGHPLGLGLQPFDHPFHLGLGVLGLGAAVVEYVWPRTSRAAGA